MNDHHAIIDTGKTTAHVSFDNKPTTEVIDAVKTMIGMAYEMTDKYTIYLDFDGTVVEHMYPEIGRVNFGAFEVIKKLQDAGHRLAINTFRANIGLDYLSVALLFINGQLLKPIEEYMTRKVNPEKWDWQYWHEQKVIYIDDMCTGIPLKPAVMSKGEMVDWDELDKQFIEHKIYSV